MEYIFIRDMHFIFWWMEPFSTDLKKEKEKISKIIKDGVYCSIMYMLQLWHKEDNKCLIFRPIENQIFAVYIKKTMLVN